MTDTQSTPGEPPGSPAITRAIRAELARRGLTVRDAQEALEISATTWEGRMRHPGLWRWRELESLAELLQVPPSQLVQERDR